MFKRHAPTERAWIGHLMTINIMLLRSRRV